MLLNGNYDPNHIVKDIQCTVDELDGNLNKINTMIVNNKKRDKINSIISLMLVLFMTVTLIFGSLVMLRLIVNNI